jgi:hypothetical protein
VYVLIVYVLQLQHPSEIARACLKSSWYMCTLAFTYDENCLQGLGLVEIETETIIFMHERTSNAMCLIFDWQEECIITQDVAHDLSIQGKW